MTKPLGERRYQIPAVKTQIRRDTLPCRKTPSMAVLACRGLDVAQTLLVAIRR